MIDSKVYFYINQILLLIFSDHINDRLNYQM
jgi:hypothetical protein